MKSLFEQSKKYTYYDNWEERTHPERESLMRQRLVDYVSFAKKLPFYSERLAGFDPTAEHPLLSVQPIDSDMLKELVPPASDQIVSSDSKWYNVFQSGGTTGFPKTALFSKEEMQLLTPANARGYYATGLVEEDRVANVFAGGSLYMTYTHVHNFLEAYGCTNFALAHTIDPELFEAVVRRFNVNCLAGVGSTMMNFLNSCDVDKNGPLRMEKIFYGGEHMYDADKNMLSEKYGVESVFSPGYGTVDTWYIGYQCKHTATGIHHVHDDQCYIEIINEDTGEPCKPGEVGMMYCTAFERRLTPIVRYRVGDLAMWLADPCECGRTTPLFKLLGRGDDKFRIGFDTIEYSHLQDVFTKFGKDIGLWQMERRREQSKDLLVIRIETTRSEEERTAFAEEITRAILDSRPVLRKNIEEGTVRPLAVELDNPGSLPLNPRTGKLRRVIDIN